MKLSASEAALDAAVIRCQLWSGFGEISVLPILPIGSIADDPKCRFRIVRQVVRES